MIAAFRPAVARWQAEALKRRNSCTDPNVRPPSSSEVGVGCMEKHEQVTQDEARAGQTPGVARYVLVISTLLAVLIFAALLIIWR